MLLSGGSSGHGWRLCPDWLVGWKTEAPGNIWYRTKHKHSALSWWSGVFVCRATFGWQWLSEDEGACISYPVLCVYWLCLKCAAAIAWVQTFECASSVDFIRVWHGDMKQQILSWKKRRSNEHHRGTNGIVKLYAGTKEETKNHAVPIIYNPNPDPCHIFPKFCVFCFNFYVLQFKHIMSSERVSNCDWWIKFQQFNKEIFQVEWISMNLM